jgi:hypothetical protein
MSLKTLRLEHQKTPKQVWESKELTKRLQKLLVKQGAPLEWPNSIIRPDSFILHR